MTTSAGASQPVAREKRYSDAESSESAAAIPLGDSEPDQDDENTISININEEVVTLPAAAWSR